MKICFILIFIGCGEPSTIMVEGPVKLLKNPFPLDYPKSNPQENEIISILSIGDKGKVVDVSYGKDFKVYKVKMESGKRGFLIHGDHFKVLKSSSG